MSSVLSFLGGIFSWIIDLGTGPMLSVIIFVVGLVFRIPLKKNFKAALMMGMGVDEIIFRTIGKYLTYSRFNGEDVGTQNAPLMSTETYREVVRPFLEKEWKTAKQLFTAQNPLGKIGMHSCGAVFDFVPQFIEMGADIMNPVQPNAVGMDTARLKATYGDKICFHGAIETQTVLTRGTVEDVREEVRKRIHDLAPGGGYIVAPSHNIQFGMSPENIVAMYEAIHEFGKYPIQV